MFTPISQGGDGMQLTQFVWQQYDVGKHRNKGFPPTDVFSCF